MNIIIHFNTCLKSCIDSKTNSGTQHLYLSIEQEKIVTTSDKSKASPLRKVLEAIHQLSQQISSTNTQGTKEARSLRKNFIAFMSQYQMKERGWLVKIFNNGDLEHQILTNLKIGGVHFSNEVRDVERPAETRETFIADPFPIDAPPPSTRSNFSEREKTFRTKTIIYRHNGKKEIPDFEALNNETDIPLDRFILTFESELTKRAKLKLWTHRGARILVADLARNIINRHLDANTPLSPKQFLNELKELIELTNTEEIEIDRNDFRRLKIERGLRDGFDGNYDALIEEYKSGKWPPNELRTLTYDIMNKETKRAILNAIKELTKSKSFESSLQNISGYPKDAYTGILGILQNTFNNFVYMLKAYPSG